MVFTNEERMKCISNTLKQSYYIGMALIEHKINKVIKTRDGMVIYEGELVLKHQPTGEIFKIIIRSDDINKISPKEGRQFGYIETVLKKNDQGQFIEIDGFEVSKIVKGWSNE